ncbi:MAG: tetratricopeptide repeat protein [Opitutales bacterium]
MKSMLPRNPLFIALIAALGIGPWVYLHGQDEDPRKDTAKLISEVDALLKSLEADDPQDDPGTPARPSGDVLPPLEEEEGDPFRVDKSLMPRPLLESEKKPAVEKPAVSSGGASGGVAISPLDSMEIEALKDRYDKMSLEDFLKEVDMIHQQEVIDGGGLPAKADLIKTSSTGQGPDGGTDPSQTQLTGRQVPFVAIAGDDSQKAPVLSDDYIVMDGDRIDVVLAEKIREVIMETRLAHAGTGYPEPSLSIKKAEKNCNKVLYQLRKPEHKQYRRDVLLALIGMFENSEMYVEVTKSIERFLEEFAADPKYPFENGEESPTIADTHLRLGRIYRKMGAYRLAVNKFYDALNATLVVHKKKAFAFKHLAEAAMLDIADTYLEMEDYDNAIKFFSRLLKVENLHELEKGNVLFKHAYSHYQRARSNLRREARLKQDPKEKNVRVEYAPGTAPKYDFTRVKLDLRDYAFRYPQSYYVPESYYLLALTHDELNEKDDALAQVQALLRNSPYHPDQIKVARDLNDRRIDRSEVAKMLALWNFWKKKTGNYIANEFYEDGDYFKALRTYQALANIDDDPSWQIPLLYQMGFCYERLGNVGEALRIYEELQDTPAHKITSPNVKLIMQMAKQRANFVGWATAADKQLLKAASRSRY